MATFCFAFPGLTDLFGAVIDLPRSQDRKGRPLEVVYPDRQKDKFDSFFLYMAARYWQQTERAIWFTSPNTSDNCHYYTDAVNKVKTRAASRRAAGARNGLLGLVLM